MKLINNIIPKFNTNSKNKVLVSVYSRVLFYFLVLSPINYIFLYSS